jgi:CHAT domain-containing protein/Flp pilus assembly protein TadD
MENKHDIIIRMKESKMVRKNILMVCMSFMILFGFFELSSRTSEKNQMDEYNKALRLIGEEKYDKAIERLKEIITDDPDFYRAYGDIYRAYKMKHNVDSMIPFFEGLIQKNMDNAYAYYALGLACHHKKLYQKAIEKYIKAINLKPKFTRAYERLIEAYLSKKGDKDQIIQELERYLYNLIKLDSTNSSVYIALGYLYRYLYKWEKGLLMLNKAIELNPEQWESYHHKGRILALTGRYKEAIKPWETELELAQKLGYIELEGAVSGNLAVILDFLGDYETALKNYERVRLMMKKIGKKVGEATALGNIGTTYYILGEYEDALYYLYQALKIHKEIKDGHGEVRTYANIGAIFSNLGDFTQALKCYNNALSSLNKTFDKSIMGLSLANIGNVHYNQHDYKKALEYYFKALEIQSEINDRVGKARTLGNIGVAYEVTGDYDKAIEFFEKALEINKKIGNRSSEGHVLNHLGALYIATKKYKHSEINLKKALSIAMKLKIPELKYWSLANLGGLYRVQKKYEESLRNYKKAIATIESVRGKLKRGERKSGFFQNKIRIYEDISTLFLDINNPDKTMQYNKMVFNYLERSKARALIDTLTEAKANIHLGVQHELLLREEELKREYAFNQSQLQIENSKNNNKIDRNKINKLGKKLEDLNEQFKTLKTEIIRTNPKYAQLKYPEPITLNHLQQEFLNESIVLLEYMVTRTCVIVMRISKNDFKIFRFPINREELQNRINLLRESFNMLNNRTSFTKQSFGLFQQIVEPVLKDVPKGKTLLIVPDDILHYLPFEALLTTIPEKKKNTSGFKKLPFLIKKYPVHYVQSASVLASLRKEKASKERLKSKQIFAMGDPYFGEKEIQGNNFYVRTYLRTTENRGSIKRLQQSGIEVEKIGRLFHKKDIFLRENAKEELVKPPHQLDQYKYIHFSTHGLLNIVKPELSGLILAQDKDPAEDGFLQMREIFNLKIDADLVTLSACETGLGKDIRGEGLVGLTRAWMYAGTPSVLVSLWKVDDEATAKLMVSFYKNLKKGMDKAEALQKAKLWLIKQTGTFIKDGKQRKKFYGNPFYWAGFVLIGDK